MLLGRRAGEARPGGRDHEGVDVGWGETQGGELQAWTKAEIVGLDMKELTGETGRRCYRLPSLSLEGYIEFAR